MAGLSVTDLLNAADSSDEEGTPVNGNAHQGTDEVSQSVAKPELTIEQAMAQADLSDDEDEDTGLGLAAAEIPKAAQSAPVHESAPSGDTRIAPQDPPSPRPEVDGKLAVPSINDLLAMDSDDSLEDHPNTAPSHAKTTEKKQIEPAREQVSRLTSSPKNVADSKEAFIEAPFAWCLEHERSLLLASADEAAVSEQCDAKSDSNDVKVPFSCAESKTCHELRRLLAQEVGLPTCVMAHGRHVGIGTMRGDVVLLDPKIQDAPSQPIVLHPPTSDEAVAVTAAAFSPDGTSMLVGHKSGQLELWDLASQKVLNVVKDLHSSAVLSVAFCRPSWQYVLSADARGTVYFVTFSNSFGRRDCSKQLLFESTSNIGITLRILPLPHVPHQAVHPADSQCLVALCATNATVLLTLHPSVQLLQKMQYHTKDTSGNSNWIPDAVWLRMETREWVEALQVQANDPLLCIAFGQTIHIMRVSFEKTEKKEEFMIRLDQRYSWGYPIQSIVSFNESVLGVLDSSNKLTVVQLPPPAEDTRGAAGSMGGPPNELVTIHVEDVSTWSVVYHTHTSQDGGRDARCHHGALAVFKGRSRALFVCGMKEVRVLQISRWGQYIEEMVSRNNWSGALEAFLSVHKGSQPPLLDFPHVTSMRQRAVGLRTTQVVQSYLVSRLQQDTGKALARQMCSIAINACIEMKLWSVLYKTVFECFKSVGYMSVYCNTLEPFIVQGRIPAGQMDSEVLSSILQSYALPLEEEEQLALQQAKKDTPEASNSLPAFVDCDHCASLFPNARRLQQLAFYVDVSQLDLNYSIRLFTQHRLWTALVHVYCKLKDYISPLELLVGECSQLAKKCQPRLEHGSIQREAPLLHCRLIRKLFFFLHRCFELRPFPLDSKDGNGMVSPSPAAITELLTSIFKPASLGDRILAPPMFMRLLRLSPMCFFAVLSVIFTAPAGSHALHSHSAKGGGRLLGEVYHPLTLATLFQAIEDAVDAAKKQATDEGQPLPSHTDAEFLWFVAQASPRARKVLRPEQCEQVVEHLLNAQENGRSSSASSVSRHSAEEAQQLLIGVFAAQGSFDKERRDAFIATSMQRGFFGAAAWLHEEWGEYDRALDCRLRDDSLQEGIFEYIISRLAEKSDDKDRSAALADATLQRLPRLVAIDPDLCAAMVCEQFANVAGHDSVLQRLQGYPQIELQYLETLLIRKKRGLWKSPEDEHVFFNKHVIRYIELLCSMSPQSVLPFLMENEALPLRECLELCRKYNVSDGSVYLLERTGDFEAVRELLLNDYRKAVDELHKAFTEVSDSATRVIVNRAVKRLALLPRRAGNAFVAKDSQISKSEGIGANSSSNAISEGPWYEGFAAAQQCFTVLDNAYELSSRNSNLMSAFQLEELWFGILGCSIRWQESAIANEHQSKRHAGFCIALSELSHRAMSGVLAYLSLPRSLQRICSEFGSSKLGIWQGPLQSLLSGLSFQQGVLKAAQAVSAKDVVKPFLAVKRIGSRGIRVNLGEISGETTFTVGECKRS